MKFFEEIKRKYKKSNKYMLYVSYEDIGTLLNLIEKQSKEIEELKASHITTNNISKVQKLETSCSFEDLMQHIPSID